MDSSANDPKARTVKAISAVSKALNADVYLFCGRMQDAASIDFLDIVKRTCSRPNAMLMLTTFGGAAEVAYRIARCLQRHYQEGKIVLFVDSYCKSAGTLVALGVDEIIMSEGAELGPLDVQLSKPDELEEWMSGLTPSQALATLRSEAFKTWERFFLDIRQRSGFQITTKTAADIAARLATGLFEGIYAQLDPMKLGEYGLAMLIAENYGIRLARENLKEDALARLIADYPTHDFVIDREEAQELFCKVREPTEEEEELAAVVRPATDAWLRNPVRTIIENLSSNNEEEEPGEASEENSHGKVRRRPGEVSKETGPGDGKPSGTSPAKPPESVKGSGRKDRKQHQGNLGQDRAPELPQNP